MPKSNIREIFKRQILAVNKRDSSKFPGLSESDFPVFTGDLTEGSYAREDLNTAWIGFIAMVEAFDELDVVVSVDMSNPNDDEPSSDRIYAKVEEWNEYTEALKTGGELSLIAIYQSHNFDIENFRDPYVGKFRKNRPK